MRIVTVGAISSRARMLNLSLIDELRLVGVTGHAQVLDVLLGQDHFAIFRRSMTGIATLLRKGRMRELGHQLGRRGLVGIMALQTVGGGKRLVLVRLLQGGIFQIVAIHAQRRSGLRQVKSVFRRRIRASLVRDVAGIAARVKRGMATAFIRHVQSLSVARETEVVLFISRGRFQQLILICRSVWVMTLQAVSDRRRMHRSFYVRRFLVGMAGQTKSIGSGRDQHDPGDIPVNPDLMATQAAHRNSGVDRLALCFVVVAFQALGPVDVLVQGNGMNGRGGARDKQGDQGKENQEA